MKDFKIFLFGIAWAIQSVFAGHIFFDTKWEFPFRQGCEVTLLIGITQVLRDNKYPISAILFHVLAALSITELVDEIRFVNTKIRLEDYAYLCGGIIGLLIGIYRYHYRNKKIK